MSWLNIIGLACNLMGAGLLVKPLLKSKELINEISHYEDSGAMLGMGTTKKKNEPLKKSLELDNILGKVGFTFLIVGFILQLWGEVLQ
jgi:hypothetical protein